MKPGLFFSLQFLCLGTLLLPYPLLSSINNTVTTKFKFLYEMLTNLILFLFLTFILYYLDSLFLFLKNLTWMTWFLVGSCGSWVTNHQYVVSRAGMVICGIQLFHLTDDFFFKSKYNLIMYTNIIYSANYARWNIFRSIRRYHPDIYQLPSAKCLSELLILKRKVL